MSSDNNSDGAEGLENVPSDQPQDRDYDSADEDEVLETCVVDDAEYEEFLVEDEDSNIGSMVSIQSEEVKDEGEDDDGNSELIVPEVLEDEEDDEAEETKDDKQTIVKIASPKANPPDSWPTLEILPGGVINLADKNDITNLHPNSVDREAVADTGDMMYACAKCSQSFKYLFCLVKHVKWHEVEAKRAKQEMDLSKLSTLEKEMINLKRKAQELDKEHKKKKVEVFARIADNLRELDSVMNIFG